MPSDCLEARLLRCRERGEKRYLPTRNAPLDFCSNDYLGLAREGSLLRRLLAAASDLEKPRYGATGSRLLTGNSVEVEVLESLLASVHRTEASLVFNSGYDANLGLYSSLPRDDVQIFYDEQVHASAKDGIALSKAWAQPFRHNDLDHLERRLRKANKQVFVSVEALYSMDGAFAPLAAMAELCRRYDAKLIVDEAHSIGVHGAEGEGLVQELELQASVYARVMTYGKALGCHGAAVVGPRVLKKYLVNFAHSFIYSTALPSLSVQAIKIAYEMICSRKGRNLLHELTAFFGAEVQRLGLEAAFLPSTSQIQGIVMPATDVVEAARRLQEQGFDVKAIRSPTVRRGSERLRICLHSYNQPEDIKQLLKLIGAML